MALRFSLFSSFSSFVRNEESVESIYNRIPVSETILRKKLCNCGFKNTIKVQSFPAEEVVMIEDEQFVSNFVEFKLSYHNIVVGMYSNGKIRLAGKMREDMDIQKLGQYVLGSILGLHQEITPFVTNNITALFCIPHNIPYNKVDPIFRDHVVSISYPNGEVPPYTVIRLFWKDHERVVVNYTPNTGSFQILGGKTVEEVKSVHSEVLQILSSHQIGKPVGQEENAKKVEGEHEFHGSNKFARVGMKKEGRGRPTVSFMKEYQTRLDLLNAGKARTNEHGEFVLLP